MSVSLVEEERLKALLKEALIEVLQEQRELFTALLLEALEDLALIRAIQEGEHSGVADREEVHRVFEGNP